MSDVWPCADLHAQAKKSVPAFRRLLEIVGVQRSRGPDLLMGNCPKCDTTISIVDVAS